MGEIYAADKVLMASKSRAAQEKLAELEQSSAPFEEQLLEAARFVGVDLENADRSASQSLKSADGSISVAYYGREEWLMRWLLKRLQDQKDDVPRNAPNSWALLGHLIRVLPLPNAARMLNERKFMTILRQTLEEAVKAASDGGVPKPTSDIGSGLEDKPSKVSKKRKRSGELISSHSDSGDHVQKLPGAIFAAMHQMLRLANISFDLSKGDQTTAFSTEYMKSVIRTPAEDAAKILGAWLSLCRISLKGREGLDTDGMKLWLSPFIEIWGCRTVGSEDLMQFSLHCSQSLLSLFKAMKTVKAPPERLMGEMEQLIARNIMIPAKAAKLIDADSDLLSNLTRISVIQDSATAPILFEVAVRSIQAHGSRRRRPNDESWLQNVFSVLKDAMPPIRAEENGKALREMLLSATKYKVALELSILRSITLEYCLLEEGTDWALLATIIKLDANVFLIKPEGEDLAQQVLTRITAASLRPTWSELSVQVVSEVLVPLMISFASARELSSFVRHWHTQLVEFRKAQTLAQASWMALFSAWEDEHLQAEFFKIMEPSLTVFQISQLLDWLSSQSTEYPDATCVILEAMAGSISQEEVVDAVGLRIFHIMFDNKASKNLDARYKWRSSRILSRIVTWIPQSGLQEISALWEEQAAPFHALSSSLKNGTFLDAVDSNIMELERFEMLRCACAAWNASQKGTKMAVLTKKPVLDFLRSLLLDRKQLRQLLTSDMGLAEQDCRSTLNTLHPGACWMLRSSFSCVVVEFPAVLGLGVETTTEDGFRELLETIFWIASVPKDVMRGTNCWLHHNPDAFSSMWKALLNNDGVLNNQVLVSLIIDITLCNATNDTNPLLESPTINRFAVQCLLQLPIEAFSRKDRERIMKTWLPSSGSTEGVDGAVLSLKVKIMQRPTFFEGTNYQDLVLLADSLTAATPEVLDVSLPCFKELVRRTMSPITANLDQPRNRDYASDAVNHLRKKLNIEVGSKKAHKLSFASVALFEVSFDILGARQTQLNELKIITKSDFSSLKETFQNSLLAQMQDQLIKTKKSSKSSKQAGRMLLLRTTIDALARSDVEGKKVASAAAEAKTFAASLDGTDEDLVRRLEGFISKYTLSADSGVVETQLEGDVTTLYGRQALAEKTNEFIKSKDDCQKLALLHSSLSKDWAQLDKIWAVRQIIISCEDSRQGPDEDDEVTTDLSSIYSLLCGHLWQTTSFRQFALMSEAMAMMLRTKSRAINQWNVDSTLGLVTIMCSRNAPPLRPTRAGSIYTHICQLVQTLLTSHRLKLEGHFHLVVQAMQALLRCLFTPLPHSTSKTSKIFAQPPWLSSPKHSLNAKHAAAFTRLVTLICNPSVSSVTRSKHNNLTSATDKAKRMAGQHMHFVLTLYVQLQLEMRMLPEVREKMIPGLYAIFDTTTPEMRKMISDGLDSSGRAVFGMLFKDYHKFGRWKGS